MPLSPAFSTMTYFMNWLVPLIVNPLAVEPAFLAFLKSKRGYVPSGCFIPTIPPALEPESLMVDFVLKLITGVLIY